MIEFNTEGGKLQKRWQNNEKRGGTTIGYSYFLELLGYCIDCVRYLWGSSDTLQNSYYTNKAQHMAVSRRVANIFRDRVNPKNQMQHISRTLVQLFIFPQNTDDAIIMRHCHM